MNQANQRVLQAEMAYQQSQGNRHISENRARIAREQVDREMRRYLVHNIEFPNDQDNIEIVKNLNRLLALSDQEDMLLSRYETEEENTRRALEDALAHRASLALAFQGTRRLNRSAKKRSAKKRSAKR